MELSSTEYSHGPWESNVYLVHSDEALKTTKQSVSS